uniref:BTB domain-containing protein n=2 Tax=Meloidogyne TaxID=189290 RepID=A0A915MA67_MELJA
MSLVMLPIKENEQPPCTHVDISLSSEDQEDTSWIDCSEELSKNCFSQFGELRKSGHLTDVIIKVEGREIPAHRIILAATIPFFNAMFTCEMIEAYSNVITLPNIDADTMESILNFAYSGRLKFTFKNIERLLKAAVRDYLQLTILSNRCAEIWKYRISEKNVFSIRRFALMYNIPQAVIDADCYIQQNFCFISKTTEFAQLDFTTLINILNWDQLHVDNEGRVFEAVCHWIEFDISNRLVFAPKLLTAVRLPLLRPAYLIDKVSRNPYFCNSMECRDLIDEAKNYHLMPERRSNFNSIFKINIRVCTEIPGNIYVLGGLNQIQPSTVEFYDPTIKKWKPSKVMTSQRTRVGVAVSNGKIYVVGGYNGSERLRCVEMFDTVSGNWVKLVSMFKRRSAMCATALGEHVYVIGGYDGTNALDSVEVYEIKSDYWAFGPPMLAKRCAAGIAISKGYYDGNFLKSAEVYDPETDTWSSIAPMNLFRARVSLVTNGNFLYAIGGYDGENNLNSVEIYNPAKNQWEFGAAMTSHEGGVGAVVVPTMPRMHTNRNNNNNGTGIMLINEHCNQNGIGEDQREHARRTVRRYYEDDLELDLIEYGETLNATRRFPRFCAAFLAQQKVGLALATKRMRRLLPSTILILLFIISTLIGYSSSIYFHIAETERKCFIEEIPDETMVMSRYKVQLFDPNTKAFGDYPTIGMHVEVKDPEEKMILSKLYTNEGIFTFTSHSPGEHLICLYSNTTAWFSGAQLRVHLDIQVGEHAQDYQQIAAKDKLNDLQLRVRQLLDQVEQITKEQNYQRYREERFRQTSEGTNSRVLWWSAGQTIVLLLTGLSGVGIGFGYFRNKRDTKHYDLDEQDDKTFIVTDPESIHNFAYKLTKDETKSFEKIDGIILNAATKVKKYKLNKQGIETNLATNHFGNFLLVGLLLQKLLNQDTSSKIVFVNTNIAAKDGLNLNLFGLNDGKFVKKLTSTCEIVDPEKGSYDMHAAYKYSKLMDLLFARELAERLKDTQVQVVVADPGGTKTDLNKDEPSQKFFLTRWTSNALGYVAGNRRPVNTAIYPILYALGEDGVKNGTFISPRQVPREWGENAENVQLRQKVWLMSEQWTKLADYMGRMEEGLEKLGYFSKDSHGDDEGEKKKTRQRSAKYLWLA